MGMKLWGEARLCDEPEFSAYALYPWHPLHCVDALLKRGEAWVTRDGLHMPVY
jgi:hypothetical protein